MLLDYFRGMLGEGSGLGFSLVVANMQKNTVNYDKIVSWESLLGSKFVHL